MSPRAPRPAPDVVWPPLKSRRPRPATAAAAEPVEPAELSFDAADGARIVIQVFPKRTRLLADVRRVIATVAATNESDEVLREQAEAELRPLYPRIRIRPRHDLASLSDHERAWYVLRDGRIHSRPERLDRLHDALGHAREIREATSEVLERSRSTLQAAHRSGPRGAPDDAPSGDTE